MGWLRFVILSFFLFSNTLSAQQLADPVLEADLSHRISGFADPTVRWDEAWPAKLADWILKYPQELDTIYIQIGTEIYEVYGEHGLSIDPSSDGGRFLALQTEINSRVDLRNQSYAEVETYTIGGAAGVGLLAGAIVGWTTYRRQSFTRRMAVGVLGLGILGGICGAGLAHLASYAWHEPLPRFSSENPSLKSTWAKLESLEPTSSR